MKRFGAAKKAWQAIPAGDREELVRVVGVFVVAILVAQVCYVLGLAMLRGSW